MTNIFVKTVCLIWHS